MRLLSCLLILTCVSNAMAQSEQRPRAREAGVIVGLLPTGKLNAITDVAGVRVGQVTVSGKDLGAGTVEDRLAFLLGIVQEQKQIMATAGLDNPLVNPINLYNAYSKALELGGWKDPTQFFTDPRTWEPPPPKPTPEELLAQVEMEKNRGELAVKVEGQKLEREKFVEQADFNRDKLDAEIMLKVKELELNHETQIETAELGAKVSQDRIPIGSITKAITRSTEGAMEKVSEGLMKKLAELQAPQVVVPPPPKRRKKINRDAKGNIESVEDEDIA